MKLSINEIYTLHSAKAAYDAQKKRAFQLSLLMVSNTKALQSVIDDFEKVREELLNSDEIKKYNDERRELINSHRMKDGKGNFIVEKDQNGQQGFKLEKVEELTAKIEVFDTEHKEIVEQIKKNEEIVMEESLKETEVRLKKINKKEMVEILELRTLVLLAPIISIKLTEDLLADKADKLTITDLERLEKFCTIA